VAALAIVGLVTAAAEGLYQLTHSTRLSVVFLAGVLITAFMYGTGPAYFAAGVAFLAYNFYLSDPRFTFTFNSDDMVTLVIFFWVAMLTGNLTGRMRDEARRAQARAATTAALFDATREFSASDDEDTIRGRMAHYLAEAADGQAVVCDEDGYCIAAPQGIGLRINELPQRLRKPIAEVEVASAETSGWTVRPLAAAGVALGAAAWRPAAERRLEADQKTLLDILADTGAAAVGRARLSQAKADAEARAKTEDLRNALLSSISHDLRTPLSAILASATSLQSFGDQFDSATRKDLANTIQEEAERLNAFVANLLSMTKLEAGALTVEPTPFSLREVVDRIVRRQEIGETRSVAVNIAPDDLEAVGDVVLFEQALWNVIENALRHTPPEVPVEVAGVRVGDEVLISVMDEGPGVSPAELVMLFVKFYRTTSAEKIRGTGLGLSITKGLIEGMGGRVAAHNQEPPKTGLIVTLVLPAEEA
jgi:two-component system sensor histidine kinase KdpD